MKNFLEIAASPVSLDTKLQALAISLDRKLPELSNKVLVVEKQQGPKGDKGDKGDAGERGFDGVAGKDGRDGVDGLNGEDGKDGISIVDIYISADNSLVCILSDGREVDAGQFIDFKNTPTATIYSRVSESGSINDRVVELIDSTSITINADITDIAVQTNTQNVGILTINAPTGNLVNGQKLMLRLQSTNVQTFSWSSVFAGSSDLPLPSESSGASKYDYVGFVYNSLALKWQIIAKNFGF
jgi:hypothetical protein